MLATTQQVKAMKRRMLQSRAMMPLVVNASSENQLLIPIRPGDRSGRRDPMTTIKQTIEPSHDASPISQSTTKTIRKAGGMWAPNVEVERGTQAQLEAVRTNAGLGARKAARLHLAARQNDTDDTQDRWRRQRKHRRARRRVKLNPLAATANSAERSHCPTKPDLPAQRDAEHKHHRFDRAFACRIPNA
jgi:hypothetical protein